MLTLIELTSEVSISATPSYSSLCNRILQYLSHRKDIIYVRSLDPQRACTRGVY